MRFKNDRWLTAVCLLLALFSSAGALGGQKEIATFDYSNPADAAQDWMPSPGASDPQAVGGLRGGVRFNCPFSDSAERFYWDKETDLQLASYETIEIKFSCRNPANI